MKLQPQLRLISCFAALALAAVTAQAAPPKLPATAIAEDTFFVATLNLAKLDPASREAAAKAALGDKAGDVEEMLTAYKAHYEKFAGKGAQTATIVMRGDPDQQQQGPEPVMYVSLKAGADHEALEKQIREEEGENNPQPMEISHDGDFMVMRKKGQELPATGSEERAKLFSDALGNAEKPAVAVLIFNEAMLKGVQKAVGQGMPPALATLATDSKSMRLEVTLGEGMGAEITLQGADEEAAKRLADAVTGLGDLIRAEIPQMKQAVLQPPVRAAVQVKPMLEMVEPLTAIAEALKPEQAGAKVTIKADAKVAGAMFRVVALTQRMAVNAAPAKGGL
jgi:hypothetical protein